MSDDRSLPREFVDSNIFVYAYDNSAGAKHEVAARLLERLWNTRRGCISIQVLQEFFVVTTSRVRPPLSRTTARKIVTEYREWVVHSPTPSHVEGAMDIQERYDVSFWDAMIIESSSRLGCETLWSEDLNPGQIYEGVTVRNPFTQD